jgi:hypothetical protein
MKIAWKLKMREPKMTPSTAPLEVDSLWEPARYSGMRMQVPAARPELLAAMAEFRINERSKFL